MSLKTLTETRLVPVAVIPSADRAVPLAETLMAAGAHRKYFAMFGEH